MTAALQRVTFMSRSLAEKLLPPPNSVLISIHDKSQPELVVREGWEEVLYVRFHDSDGRIMGLEDFSVDHGQRILDFVTKHLGRSDLVVHCQAGQSRSAGVALFFAEMLGLPCLKPSQGFSGGPHPVRRQAVQRSGYPYYNRRVYGVLSAVMLGADGEAFRTAAEL